MRVVCPSCHGELSLDVLLTHEAARIAVAQLAQVSIPFGALTLRYIALFRPEKRGLSIERMVKLINDLVPDLQRQAITRKGRDWGTDLETWRAAMETVLTKRDKGTLTLPLTSHGLLYEVIASMVDRVEARAEHRVESERRAHRPAGAAGGPRNLADIAQTLDSGAMPPPVAPAVYSGPSRAALAIKAQIEASQRRPADAPQPESQA